MNFIFFVVSILASLILFCLGAFLLRNRYVRNYEEDRLITSDESKFAIFEVDDKYKEYLSTYKIFKEKDNRFLSLKLRNNIKYIDYNIVCCKDQKVVKIINVKDTLFSYKQDYIVKLPLIASSFKIDVNQINDEKFEVNEIKRSKLSFVLSSILFAVGSVIPLFLIYLIVFSYLPSNKYLSWNDVMDKIFGSYLFYIVGAILLIVVFLISFLGMLFSNKPKNHGLKENKKKEKLEEKDFDISKYLKFKVKEKFNKKENKSYFIAKCKKKKDLYRGTLLLKIFDEEDKQLLAVNYNIDKHIKKIVIKKEDIFKRVEVVPYNVYFKYFRYVNNEPIYNEYNNRQGVKGRSVYINGLLYPAISTLLVFVASLVSVASAGMEANVLRYPEGVFSYEFIDEENVNAGIRITSYRGSSSKIYIPSKLYNYDVKEIAERAFQNNESIKEAYFSSEIVLNNYAFSGCSNLTKVDLNNVSYIGRDAFFQTSLKEVTINQNVTYLGSRAFGGIETLDSITINSNSNNEFENSIFALSKVDGKIVVNGSPSYRGNSPFTNVECEGVFFYDLSIINKNNYKQYFNVNSPNPYLKSSCVHDDVSFMEQNGQIINVTDSEIVSETQSTCSENGIITYRCNYCNQTYDVTKPLDPNNHNYVDGVCTWCGRVEN